MQINLSKKRKQNNVGHALLSDTRDTADNKYLTCQENIALKYKRTQQSRRVPNIKPKDRILIGETRGNIRPTQTNENKGSKV